MIAALEKAGRKPEELFLASEGHGIFANEKARNQIFKRVEEFLAAHLTAPEPPVNAAKPP